MRPLLSATCRIGSRPAGTRVSLVAIPPLVRFVWTPSPCLSRSARGEFDGSGPSRTHWGRRGPLGDYCAVLRQCRTRGAHPPAHGEDFIPRRCLNCGNRWPRGGALLLAAAVFCQRNPRRPHNAARARLRPTGLAHARPATRRVVARVLAVTFRRPVVGRGSSSDMRGGRHAVGGDEGTTVCDRALGGAGIAPCVAGGSLPMPARARLRASSPRIAEGLGSPARRERDVAGVRSGRDAATRCCPVWASRSMSRVCRSRRVSHPRAAKAETTICSPPTGHLSDRGACIPSLAHSLTRIAS